MDFATLFVNSVRDYPDHLAIQVGTEEISYKALAERVSGYIQKFASATSPRVMIALPQGVDAYAVIFATALSGGLHSPVNLAAPQSKLERVARLFHPDFIVGDASICKSLGSAVPTAIPIDSVLVQSSDQPLVDTTCRHPVSYVLFTSGSTGLPKGVPVSRSAINHYVDWVKTTLAIVPTDRLSQHPNLGFDISMTDVFGALCSGASLHPLIDNADRLLPARFIKKRQISVWNSVPSVVALMMQAEDVTSDNLSSVRLFNFCGEPLLKDHLDAIFQACPTALVNNTYGPTEATVAVTCNALIKSNYHESCEGTVAIGSPNPGVGIHLIGGPSSREGEIVITGVQLADGYWNEPEKTAEAFRTLVVNREPTRAYFTGDWAVEQQGKIYFKERIDFQVKINGYRIELDEVAAAIRDCGYPVVCVFKSGDALAAVVERSAGKAFNELELLAELTKKIEKHAIPYEIRDIASMPRNENDKIDRKAAIQWYEAGVV
jgi:D-alanine--poly(phosphoribitol) ligase subunit 1